MSATQDEGHDALPPLHTYGTHDGLPADPAVTLKHVPTDPATLQASQAPPHAVSQQTPSMQLPLVHWLLVAHAAPLASFGLHRLALQ